MDIDPDALAQYVVDPDSLVTPDGTPVTFDPPPAGGNVTSLPRVANIIPHHPRYEALVLELQAEPLASQWWTDAESRHTPGIAYVVTFVGDTPAAWAGYRIQPDYTLSCCNNYVRREFRDHDLDLYALAYTARHHDVVETLALPAVTYLFPEPISLHEADGWVRDLSPEGSGTSRPFEGGPVHHWQRLTWAPR